MDQLLVDHTVTGPDAGLKWILADHLGTVRALADFAGGLVQRIQYGAFGQIRKVLIPGNPDQVLGAESAYRFGFTGREWEPLAELYNYRTRWYDPHSGPFQIRTHWA